MFEPRVLPTAFERASARHPNKDAIICDQTRLTYAEIGDQARRFAAGLRAVGVERGNWVAIVLPNCPEFTISVLAIARLGAVIAPLDIYYRAPELAQILKRNSVRAVVTCREMLEVVEAAVEECPDLKHVILETEGVGSYPSIKDIMETGPSNVALESVKPHDPLVCLHTGGSSDLPRGILLTHILALSRGRSHWNTIPLTARDTVYNLAPLFRGPALLTVMVPTLCRGATVVMPSRFRPDDVWRELETEQATIFHANPFHIAALANHPPERNLGFPSLRFCYSSGNRLLPVHAEALERLLGVPVIERYATAEAGGICRNGFARSEVHIKLIDEDGTEIADSEEVGEIVVKTPYMVTQYHNLPLLSAETFKEGWFHTGDFGRFDPEGKLHILYRRKTAVRIRGKWVYADEIREALECHPSVKTAMVVRNLPVEKEEFFNAYIVLRTPCEPHELRDHCRRQLGADKVPRVIEIRKDLPRSWKTVTDDLNKAYPKWGGA